ncbi:hypothetical protein [Sunxiuqinia sp. sy24]|uniref:hypothetical protein n=1 Tax=Sunxiuqinia sp. sy24 TaxID=3461495 RepID=UPI0040467109
MSQTKKNKIWGRLSRWSLALFLGLVLLGGGLLVFFADSLIQKELNAYLKEKTAGQYYLKLDDLSINIFTRSLSIQEIELQKQIATQSSDFLKAQTLSLHGIDLYKLLVYKKLHVKKLEIVSPSWTLQTDSLKMEKSESPFAFIKHLQSLFGKNLRSIAFDEIALSNAGFIEEQISSQVQPDTMGALNLNIGVLNFYTDSALLNQPEDFFQADDIFLRLENFKKALSDSIHELQIEKIQYSLKNKDITGQLIQLAPITNKSPGRTQYFVTIPEIMIKSDQLKNLFQKDSIYIDSLFLHQADIKVVPMGNAPEMNFRKIREFDLYQLAEGEFKQLTISHLSMNARKLQIERKGKDKSSMQEFYDLNVHLDNFVLNDHSFNEPDRILYAENLYLQIDNYYLLMNDDVHRFDATNIVASTKTNRIQANQLQLKPNQNPNTNLTMVNMECDSIRLKDIDLKRLFHKREMPLQSVLAYSPKLIINQGEKTRKDQRETNSLLYYFIRNYIKGVYANVVEFDQGRFVINSDEGLEQSGEISSNFNFKLTDFSLDSISAERTDKLFFATNIELTFTDYNMKLLDQIHRLQIDRIDVSSYNNQASITNLHLFPDAPEKNARLLKKFNRSQIYEIKIPRLALSNTNIHQAFFRKNLRINNFSIIEPSISLEVFSRSGNQANRTSPRELYELLNNYIENISIGKIAAPNGNIQLVTHSRKGKTISFNNKFSVELENFHLNEAEIEKNKLFFADDFELKIEDQLFQLSDNVHNLQASEIGISSKKSEIYIRNAILYPDITSKIYGDLPLHFHINVPEIKLQGVDLEEAYFEQKLDVDRFLIHQPVINLYRSEGPQKQVNFKDIAVPLPKEMQRLMIAQFRLTEGQINIFKTNELQESKILTSKVQMIGENNSLISQTANTPATFKSNSISTTLSQVIFKPEKGNVDYTADTVHFSTRERDLTISRLLLKNTAVAQGKGFVQLEIPALAFKEVDIEQVLNEKRLHFESIQAEKPQLTIQEKGSGNSQINLYQLGIPSDISPLITEIAAHQIYLNDAELISHVGDQTKRIPNLWIELQEFAIDTLPAEHLLGAQSVQLNLKNYAFSDKADLYNFHLGEIQFNNQNNHLSIADIKINPRYSKQQFQSVIPFETDHYQGTISRLDLLNLDLKRWYEQGKLTASQLVVDGGALNIYRDKRTADDPNKQSKMPQQILKDLELPIYFDTLKLLNYNLFYEEQTPERPLPGLVYFKNMTIRAFPVTNLPYLLNAKPELTVKSSAWLMGESLMETTMNYDLLSGTNQFQVSGKLSPFDLTCLNPVTRNAAGIAVRSGRLDRFEFEFEADQNRSHGKLKFAYDNLKISILEQKDGNTKEAKFISFLTNSLVLKSKHPRTRILLPDEISFSRDRQKSIVNYWWKSIFSGAKNTFGIDENE